jgi:hypothetical protein
MSVSEARERVLAIARAAGYHNDGEAWKRLLIETRINRRTLTNAWTEGRLAKESGNPHPGCSTCKGGAA